MTGFCEGTSTYFSMSIGSLPASFYGHLDLTDLNHIIGFRLL